MKIKNLILTILVVIAIISFNSCNKTINKTEKIAFVDHHSAQNSLDWTGTYSGNLANKNNELIETEITLNTDLTYELISRQLSKNDTLRADFSWDGNNIELHDMTQRIGHSLFKVEENRLRLLDKNEEGEVQLLYKLGNSSVEDKKWQLIELKGRKINGSADTHYIIYHSNEGKLEAKANCNTLLNNYKIKNQFQLKIEAGVSTLMACPDNLEQEFLSVLLQVDNLSTDGETLSLNKARMAPLARFKLVKE